MGYASYVHLPIRTHINVLISDLISAASSPTGMFSAVFLFFPLFKFSMFATVIFEAQKTLYKYIIFTCHCSLVVEQFPKSHGSLQQNHLARVNGKLISKLLHNKWNNINKNSSATRRNFNLLTLFKRQQQTNN